jgi:N-acetylmuramic acid 6-phosphate etherase
MKSLITEQVNPRTAGIDELPTLEMLRLMNEEDRRIAEAVGQELPAIARAIDAIVDRLQAGGKLVYVGTGTSGRLGVLDASECPPTYGISPELVQAIIAGGHEACWKAIEGAEDDAQAGTLALQERGVTAEDVVVGLTASGRTPFTMSALEYAQSLGALTIAVACNPHPEIARVSDLSITPVVGPEVVAGSTRMKAGTAQKMVLNMLSTGTMVRLGYTYGNLMSNLKLTNEKLRLRAQAILEQEFGCSAGEAHRLLEEAQWDLKVAMVMKRADVGAELARSALDAAGGSIKQAARDLMEIR